jgi:hypothetical protein
MHYVIIIMLAIDLHTDGHDIRTWANKLWPDIQ